MSKLTGLIIKKVGLTGGGRFRPHATLYAQLYR